MKKAIIFMVMFALLVSAVSLGCGGNKEPEQDAFHIEFDENGVPVGTELEELPDGRKRWWHVNHWHYIWPDDKMPKLENDTNIKFYIFEVRADIGCITDKLNIYESKLDVSLLEFAHDLDLEVLDIEHIIQSCIGHGQEHKHEDESEKHEMPDGTELEVLPDGRKGWKHGDHFHYVWDEGEEPELKNDTVLEHYIYAVGIDFGCVLEKLDTNLSNLDMTLLDFAETFGLEIDDVKKILDECTHFEGQEHDEHAHEDDQIHEDEHHHDHDE